jgi:RNA-directed DNA polymerase
MVGRSLAAAHIVQNRCLPPILSLKHLARHVRVSYGFLRAVVARRRDEAYKVFKVRKLSGGDRTVCVPEPQLCRTQRWITDHILSKISPHPSSFAYFPGSSPLKCASMHCGCNWLIKLDIREFFESISEIQAYRIFSGLGYIPLVAFELARICTRIGSLPEKHHSRVWQAYPGKYRTILDYSLQAPGWLGHLPQGAPTSPMLSNLAMHHFDKEVQDLSDERGLHYTRYSDDLIFSTSSIRLTRQRLSSFVSAVFKIMESTGLRPHTAKTVVAPPGARKVVLGLLVDRDLPRLSREFRSRLRQHFYFVEKYGSQAHACKRNFDSVWGLKHHLQGILSYARQIDPEFVQPYFSRFKKIDWSN